MTDDLDDLKAAIKAATPAPDAAKKAAHLALAQKNFEDLQGSRNQVRPNSDRPASGLWTGVRNMFATLTTRGGLVVTTAIVAVGFVVLSPAGRDLLRPQDLKLTRPAAEQRAEQDEALNAPLAEEPAPAPEPAPEAPITVQDRAVSSAARSTQTLRNHEGRPEPDADPSRPNRHDRARPRNGYRGFRQCR